jgi:crotonobetainyl-CoA:carnitine CoA-transferase CaiB-like acyl-CoA transferase
MRHDLPRGPHTGLVAMLREAWRALGGDPGAAGIDASDDILPSPLAVGELACATVTAALLAAAELAEARGGARPAVSIDPAHVAAAFVSERFTRVAGRSFPAGFHALSAFMPAADGWVRLHGNYPHHRLALLAALDAHDAEEVRAAVAERRAIDVEDAVVAAGGCAAAVRDEEEWAAHPQGAAVAAAPLLDLAPAADAPPLPALPAGALPAAGLRVLDLTRVIAGPVGTRMVGALGADVLRIDPPFLPELEEQAVDAGPGKRSAFLDLREAAGRATFEELLAGADVLVHGYRPGALAAYGLGGAELSERHPHLTVVALSAWGSAGPWGDRRGFDSLVQAATGIAVACRTPGDDAPGKLPAQALDHGTGYLIAAAALRGLADRARGGRAVHAELALARTAHWLLQQPRRGEPDASERPRRPEPAGPSSDATAYLVTLPSPRGDVTLVAPPGRLDGRPLKWRSASPAPGADPPSWDTPLPAADAGSSSGATPS